MTRQAELFETARRHLRRRDPMLRTVIERVGPVRLKPKRDRFGALVRAIVAQQISVAAASSIHARLVSAAGEAAITPERIAQLSDSALRSCGLSPQKLGYLRDLTRHALEGTVPFSRLARLADEDVIACLTQVRGIGRWTAQMFLIFSLGRPDVLPHDDLGLQAALQQIYGLPDRPGRAEIDELAAPWRPYASIASWYCWRSLEFKQQAEA